MSDAQASPIVSSSGRAKRSSLRKSISRASAMAPSSSRLARAGPLSFRAPTTMPAIPAAFPERNCSPLCAGRHGSSGRPPVLDCSKTLERGNDLFVVRVTDEAKCASSVLLSTNVVNGGSLRFGADSDKTYCSSPSERCFSAPVTRAEAGRKLLPQTVWNDAAVLRKLVHHSAVQSDILLGRAVFAGVHPQLLAQLLAR